MSHSPRRVSLIKTTILIAIVCCMNGCALLDSDSFNINWTMDTVNLGKVYEKMDIQNIYVGKDGMVALEVTSKYCRYRFLESEYDYYKFAGRVCESKPIFLNQYAPRKRYILLDPSFFKECLSHYQPFTIQRLPYQHQPITIQRLPIDYIDASRVKVIPEDFWAPGAICNQLPVSLTSADAKSYRENIPIPFKIQDQDVFINFNKIKIDTKSMYKTKWWIWPVAMPVLILDMSVSIPATIIDIGEDDILMPIFIVLNVCITGNIPHT